jgi:hypothetical protein
VRHKRIEELERRIREIEPLDDGDLGSFTRWDWVICVLGGLVVPYLALWWFAP